MQGLCRIGVDVGGTNTDAALLRGQQVLATVKEQTTANVTEGIVNAIESVLAEGNVASHDVDAVMIGTTHFLNALVERRDLRPVGVLRLSGPSGEAWPPGTGWPEDLRAATFAEAVSEEGGVEYDGREIAPLDEDAVRRTCRAWQERGVEAVAICAVFANVDPTMELRAREIALEEMPDVHVSMSHMIGQTDILKRENATILNATLSGLSAQTISGFQSAFAGLDLSCELYLTQNDGTIVSADFAAQFPIFAVASGPTNSMRGAAFLTGQSDVIVIDIGGTTTDIGVLSGGFPRTKSDGAQISGVSTNFRVPDVLSIGLGGGSRVTGKKSDLQIGPGSVGYRLIKQAQVFGGDVLTTTDLIVAGGTAVLGDPARVAGLDCGFVAAALQRIDDMVAEAVDRMKTSTQAISAILVGGGSILVRDGISGVSEVLRPKHFGSANAIGAAISQVSGEAEMVVSLDNTSREDTVTKITNMARDKAVTAGASAHGLEVAELDEMPLSYLPGTAVRIRVKVVGNMQL